MAGSITLKILGGDRFMVDLRAWRDTVMIKAKQAAHQEAQRMVSVVMHGYPSRTGNLRGSVVGFFEMETADTFTYRVRATAAHANLYEFGTKGIRSLNKSGFASRASTRNQMGSLAAPFQARRCVFLPGVGFRYVTNTGKMPARHVFIPSAITSRARLNEQYRQILAQAAPGIGPGTPEVYERVGDRTWMPTSGGRR